VGIGQNAPVKPQSGYGSRENSAGEKAKRAVRDALTEIKD
jgi:hypothetical protein